MSYNFFKEKWGKDTKAGNENKVGENVVKKYSLRIHPTINNRVVHGVAHSEPVDGEVDLLDVGVVHHAGVVRGHQEVHVEGQPAHREYHHHHYHHFDHLQTVNIINFEFCKWNQDIQEIR